MSGIEAEIERQQLERSAGLPMLGRDVEVVNKAELAKLRTVESAARKAWKRLVKDKVIGIEDWMRGDGDYEALVEALSAIEYKP